MGIYQSIFELLQEFIYGGISLTADMNLTLTLLATLASVFVVALPFLVVWRVINLLVG